ncbi:hypothetical protein SVIOM342S_02578 [Streptomyces violaceorubidus]
MAIRVSSTPTRRAAHRDPDGAGGPAGQEVRRGAGHGVEASRRCAWSPWMSYHAPRPSHGAAPTSPAWTRNAKVLILTTLTSVALRR